jgi:hypothetical protein
MTYDQQPGCGVRRHCSEARRRWYAERRAKRFVRRVGVENPPARSSRDNGTFEAFLQTVAERTAG